MPSCCAGTLGVKVTSDSLSEAELSLPPRGVVSFPSCGGKIAPSRSPLIQSICLGFPHIKFSVFVYIVHMICRSAWVDESAVRSPFLRVWVSGGRIGRADGISRHRRPTIPIPAHSHSGAYSRSHHTQCAYGRWRGGMATGQVTDGGSTGTEPTKTGQEDALRTQL